MITINGREFGTAEDLAKTFGKSTCTIRRWVREGRIPRGAAHPMGMIWAMDRLATALDRGQATDKEIKQCRDLCQSSRR